MNDEIFEKIIRTLEDSKEPLTIEELAEKTELELEKIKLILGKYIKKSMGLKTLLSKGGVDPEFWIISNKIKEFNENKSIQKWTKKYCKLLGVRH